MKSTFVIYRPFFLFVFGRAAIICLMLMTMISCLELPGSADQSELSNSAEAGAEELREQTSDAAELSEPWTDPESIMNAFLEAYPDRVEEVAFRNGDWALRIEETWFYYADRKMLPESDLADAERYSPYFFYPYRPDLPELPEYEPDQIVAMEERIQERATSGIGRNMGLLDAIWDIRDVSSSDRKMKTLYLFGFQMNIHRELLEDVARVEERAWEAAEHDEELKAYIDSIGQVTGYNWRRISGTSTRSMHSYGIAIDILPRSYSQGQVYWLWARNSGLPWYALPYEQRDMPPMSLVRIFEEAGFVWGGKWRSFDTMHFEYRPEIFILSKQFWPDSE